MLCFSKFKDLLYCLSGLQYAYMCRWGFTKPLTGNEWTTSLRRGVKSGFYPVDLQSFGGLCEKAEGKTV